MEDTTMLKRLAVVALMSLAFPASAAKVKYYHLDALGSVRVVTDSAGNVVERHDYLPFGEECTTGGCAANPGLGAGEPRKFTGKERDKETGLDYFGARYYAQKAGRFTTTDPVYNWNENLLDPQRWNRYAYVRNNPFRYVDPDGRDAAELMALGRQAQGVPWLIPVGVTLIFVAQHHDEIAQGLSAVGEGFVVIGNAMLSGDGRAVGPPGIDIEMDRRMMNYMSKNDDRVGMDFTPAGKRKIDQANAEKYGGKNVCEDCGVDLVPGKRHEKGVTPPGNERQRDHIKPKSKGGRGVPENGQDLCRDCNGKKSNNDADPKS